MTNRGKPPRGQESTVKLAPHTQLAGVLGRSIHTSRPKNQRRHLYVERTHVPPKVEQSDSSKILPLLLDNWLAGLTNIRTLMRTVWRPRSILILCTIANDATRLHRSIDSRVKGLETDQVHTFTLYVEPFNTS